MAWCIVAAHTEEALQDADDGGNCLAEAGEILKVLKNKRGRLLMLVSGQEGDSDDDEGADVPDQDHPR